ncbi:MAG: 23S rRNA (uracil(1939)-C(5))-methyltransferase RlmD [Firmicutes bacterium]|nr:23S rRNA (uracil(1939)-C(5))-methyltransferase RlmD [Bacillota bacterium]
MLIQNRIYTATITDYTIQGQGIAHVEGCAVFIPNAIAGEVCEIQITKAAKTWAAGRIRRILEVSPHRVNRACPQSKLCGGCAFQHMDYQEECRLKAERVRQALNRLGGEALKTMDLLPAPETRRYRNKAQYPVAQEKQRAMAGFYREGTHQVVSCPQCGILAPEMDAVRDAVVDYMNQYRVSAYDEGSGTGLVRHIYVRKGWVSGQLLVCLVVNGTRLPRQEALLERLQRIPGFATLVLSVHQKPGNAVLGNTFHTLYGPGWIEDTLCGLTFRLSPRSFYQVNHDQAERLYELAIAGAGIQKTDVVLDLYCGVGTITLAMAKAAGRVIGVEVEPQAVADAQDNARRNGVQNAEFFCGDAGQAALSLREQGLTPDVVVVDPPRKGLSPDVIQALAQMSPRKIVYISCDPATLARDVALLKERNFQLLGARAVDMFPRCAHVETVAWLSMGEIGESTRGKQRNFDC